MTPSAAWPRIKRWMDSHPLHTLGFVFAAMFAAVNAYVWFVEAPERERKALAHEQHNTAAEDVGRKCVLSGKAVSECVYACSAVDELWNQPCANAAKRVVLGDMGPAKIRPAPKVSVVAADLEGGPQK